jgi:tRNA(fMet)-specific endonuclease VapC
MYLLDTDTLSALHRDNPQVVMHVDQANDTVAITIITRLEILRGRVDHVLKAATGAEVLRAQQWLDHSEALLALIEIVPFDATAAQIFDGLKAAQSLRKVGHADLLIASIALANRVTLVTRNLRHFHSIPRLSVENWMD